MRRSTRRPRALVLFAGDDEREGGLPQALRRRGFSVTAIDIRIGGRAHDLTRAALRECIESDIRAGEYDAVFFGTPCASVSILHRPQLRGRHHPRGLPGVPPQWQLYLAKHNALIAWTGSLIVLCDELSVAWMLENPADRGQEGSAAFWAAHRDHAPMWVQPAIVAAEAATGARKVLTAQCEFGADWQKYTTLMCASVMGGVAEASLGRTCSHGFGGHRAVAHGRDERGVSRAAQSAAYPLGFSEALADVMAMGVLLVWQLRLGVPEQCVPAAAEGEAAAEAVASERLGARGVLEAAMHTELQRRLAEAPPPVCLHAVLCDTRAALGRRGFSRWRHDDWMAASSAFWQAAAAQLHSSWDSPAPAATPGAGGRVTDGIELAAEVAAKCEAARVTPPRFASLRNLAAASRAELLLAELPSDLRADMTPTRPKQPKPPKGRALPPPTTGGEAACDAALVQPEGPIHIEQLFASGIYELEIRPWLRRAAEAAMAIEKGEDAVAVPTLRIPQARMPAWARGIVWDTRDPRQCVPVERSTRDTVFPGRRQMKRAALRQLAAVLDWHDTDILRQAGEGGIEPKSSVALDTVLTFHHQGLIANLSDARKVIEAHRKEEWVTDLFLDLPMVPCRCTPRNVIQQERARAGEDGRLETYFKPRVTSNSSDGAAESVNGGTRAADRYVRLPTAQQLGRGAAIVQVATSFDWASDVERSGGGAALGGVDASGAEAARAADCGVAVFAVDLESAYSFCAVQRAWWWTQVFVWWEWRVEEGVRRLVVGLAIDTRLGFGGAFAPNRFERISTLVSAGIERERALFDRSHPYPPRVQAWRRFRGALQQAGRLSLAGWQREPRHLQVYIDDVNGAATTDHVGVQHEYASIAVSTEATLLAGGEPAAAGSRAVAHTQIAISVVRSLGFSDSPGKTCVGDRVGSLGFCINIGAFRIACPSRKRETMLADLAAQAQRALSVLEVDLRSCGTLVGRLVNLSQIYPELRSYLHGGYAVAGASRGVERRDGRHILRLSGGRAAQNEFLTLLDEASSLVDSNEGVPLAASSSFSARSAPGTWTSTTDASGVDGVGGYVFSADTPNVVWLVSERWPPEVLAALQAAASQGAARQEAKARGVDMLSMPAAELLGAWMIPQAVQEATGSSPEAVFAISDCDPAVHSLNSATGGNPQMRVALSGARGLSSRWLAVHVHRELNLDADRLSHPHLAYLVALEAAQAGLRVEEARISEAAWAVARRAAAAGVGGGRALGLAPSRSKRPRQDA